MLSIRVQGTKKVMGNLEREVDRIMTRVAQDTLVVARKNTPIDKGQARRGWRLENATNEKRIVNRVPYIDLLEKGRSKQAPRGILGPTTREISQRRYR
tara:strand:- start:914 stop:1207 length:294 start_codon:yes stop_codon:yes gene_type:complete